MYEKVYAFDLEHTGFNRFEGDLLFAYCWTNVTTGVTEVYRIPIPEYGPYLRQLKRHNWNLLETPQFKEFSNHDNYLRLQEFLSDNSIVKAVHNVKHEKGYLRANGLVIPDDSIWHCTMLASQHLMNLAPSHALDEQAYNIYKYPMDQDDRLMKVVKWEQSRQKLQDKKAKHERRIYTSCFEKVPKKLMHEYQVADGERGALLYNALIPRLYQKPDQWKDYLVDLDLLDVTIAQEEWGIKLDDTAVDDLLLRLQREYDESLMRIEKDAGRPINPKSPDQLRDFILNDLGFPLTKKTKSNKNWSTDSKVLAQLYDDSGEEVLNDIMKCVAYKTGIGSVKSYPKLAHPATRKIHANHKTNQARTGRQSVSNPNLQNIAKEKSASRFPVPARYCFVADEGYDLYMPDYSGIEMRLIASEANEQEFIDVLNGNHVIKDMHALSALVIFDDQWRYIEELLKSPHGMGATPKWLGDQYTILGKEDPAGVRYVMRSGSKNYSFGTAYGGQLEATGINLVTMTWEEKVEASKRFMKRFPKLSNFATDTQAEVRANGYVTTPFGRRLYISKKEPHKGANYKIQGCAAGVLKRAEVRVDNYCRYQLDNLIREVVTVHDELVLAVSHKLGKDLPYALADIKRLMEVHPEIKVPMEIEYKKTSTSWAEAKEIKLDIPKDWKFGELTRIAA